MKLYVANVSTQNQIIYYRLDYTLEGTMDRRLVIPAKQSPVIPPGRQFPLGGELGQAQVDSIISQLTPYGLIAESEVPRLKPGRKVTYVCNVDRPVSAETIRLVNDHNRGVKIAAGAEMRKKAAIGASSIVDNVVTEATPPGAPAAPLKEFDISVEQEDQSPLGEKPIAEGLKVDLAAASSPAPRGGGPRRSRKAA